MMMRALAALLLAWMAGFIVWAVTWPAPALPTRTDAIVVVTGGAGRIARGVDLLEDGRAKRMLISGVDPSVRDRELGVSQRVPPRLLACCIDLGRAAVDTYSNAQETAAWVARRRYASVRLVTTDWHMRRAHWELTRAVGPGVTIVADAVPSNDGLGVMLREYNKYVLRRIAALIGL